MSTAIYVPVIAIIFLIASRTLVKQQEKRLEIVENESEESCVNKVVELDDTSHTIKADNEEFDETTNEEDSI